MAESDETSGYDVAISFLARDESTAKAVAEQLEAGGLKVFFFPHRQEDLAGTNGMESMRAPYHPMTQGKIERWHQTLKNRILLENYYLPGDLEEQIETFVADYNHRRYHESIDNLTPADVYFGRGQTILLQRERIKRQTIAHRRLQYQRQAA